ncbi:MAG: hypothetical protein WD402_04500 [Chloroflexota bacterium]
MQFIEFVVKGQAPRPAGHIGPDAHSSHSLQRRVEGAASGSGDKRVQLEVGLDESGRFTRQDSPMALLEQEVEVELLAFRTPS